MHVQSRCLVPWAHDLYRLRNTFVRDVHRDKGKEPLAQKQHYHYTSEAPNEAHDSPCEAGLYGLKSRCTLMSDGPASTRCDTLTKSESLHLSWNFPGNSSRKSERAAQVNSQGSTGKAPTARGPRDLRTLATKHSETLATCVVEARELNAKLRSSSRGFVDAEHLESWSQGTPWNVHAKRGASYVTAWRMAMRWLRDPQK